MKFSLSLEGFKNILKPTLFNFTILLILLLILVLLYTTTGKIDLFTTSNNNTNTSSNTNTNTSTNTSSNTNIKTNTNNDELTNFINRLITKKQQDNQFKQTMNKQGIIISNLSNRVNNLVNQSVIN